MKSFFSFRHQGDGKGEEGAGAVWPSQDLGTKLLCAQAGTSNTSMEGLKHNHIPSFLVVRPLNIGLVICFLPTFVVTFRTVMVL